MIKLVPQSPDTDMSPILNNAIENAAEGETLQLEKGEYFLKTPLLFNSKKHLVFDGGNSTLLPYYDPSDDYGERSADCLHLDFCEDVALRNFKVTSSFPSDLSGRILHVCDQYTDITLDTDLAVPDQLAIHQAMLFDESGKVISHNFIHCRTFWDTFAEEVANSHTSTCAARSERIGEKEWRIYSTSNSPFMKPGTRCNITFFDRLTLGRFRSCENITVENVHVASFGGMGFVILPHSSDFTFRNVRFQPDDPMRHPYSLLADSIHTTGLGGKLVIEDCVFDGIGDDTLNDHGTILTVRAKDTEVSGNNHFILFFDKENPLFPKRWCKVGDTIRVYDGKTLAVKGTTTLTWVREHQVSVADPALLEVGDYVINTAFCPEIVLKNCLAQHARSRFAIQSASRVEISGCTFRQCSFKPQIYISTAFTKWAEGGGVSNVSIHDNVLDALAPDSKAIWIRLNESDWREKQYSYQNIEIYNNTITGIIDASVTNGLSIHDNKFVDTAEPPVSVEHCPDADVRI